MSTVTEQLSDSVNATMHLVNLLDALCHHGTVGEVDQDTHRDAIEGHELDESADMLDWLEDCFGDNLPADLTTAEIADGIARHYDGGIPQFLADGAP